MAQPGDDLEQAARRAEDARLDDLCERLVWWCRTRRCYDRRRLPPSLLGRLGTRTGPYRAAPDVVCSAELSALYLAMLGQPDDSLDRRVFELHYFGHVRYVKTAAATVGVSRQHWYRLLRDFRRRIYAASQEIRTYNEGPLPGVAAAERVARPLSRAEATK